MQISEKYVLVFNALRKYHTELTNADQMHTSYSYASVHFENVAYGIFSPQYVVINNTKTLKKFEKYKFAQRLW